MRVNHNSRAVQRSLQAAVYEGDGRIEWPFQRAWTMLATPFALAVLRACKRRRALTPGLTRDACGVNHHPICRPDSSPEAYDVPDQIRAATFFNTGNAPQARSLAQAALPGRTSSRSRSRRASASPVAKCDHLPSRRAGARTRTCSPRS